MIIHNPELIGDDSYEEICLCRLCECLYPSDCINVPCECCTAHSDEIREPLEILI